jgi:hypothetical protein
MPGASYGARSKSYALDTAGIEAATIADMNGDVDTSTGHGREPALFANAPTGRTSTASKTARVSQPYMYVHVDVEKKFQTLLAYPGIPAASTSSAK